MIIFLIAIISILKQSQAGDYSTGCYKQFSNFDGTNRICLIHKIINYDQNEVNEIQSYFKDSTCLVPTKPAVVNYTYLSGKDCLTDKEIIITYSPNRMIKMAYLYIELVVQTQLNPNFISTLSTLSQNFPFQKFAINTYSDKLISNVVEKFVQVDQQQISFNITPLSNSASQYQVYINQLTLAVSL
ncbi:hypothetical protein ABPG73_007723, partial [Tetrahymena malaccensis]